MKRQLLALATGAAFLSCAGLAHAEGKLNIYNWGDYTSPELVKKFEEKYDVDVTVTDFDSNDTALSKIRQGGSGFDIVVPSASYVPIWIKEGLIQKTNPNKMENFKNVDERWVDVPYDPGREYTVPWQWGTTGVTVNKSIYSGDPNTAAIFLDPPKELVGKIIMLPEMVDVMHMTINYVGGEMCTDDLDTLKKVRDLLKAAKPKWLSIDYPTVEKYAKGDFAAGTNWSGDSLRARLRNPDIVYGYPKDGYPIWMDNVAVLSDAKNVENAKLFQNFIMDPENAALISKFARYANGIKGTKDLLPEDMRDAPEIDVPEEFKEAGSFSPTCSPKAMELYTKIWTDVLK